MKKFIFECIDCLTHRHKVIQISADDVSGAVTLLKKQHPYMVIERVGSSSEQ